MLTPALAVLGPLGGRAVPAAAAAGPNLIVNGGAEDGGVSCSDPPPVVPGWTARDGFGAIAYGSCVGCPTATSPGPANRGGTFFHGGFNSAASSGTQVVDVTAEATAIDAGTAGYELGGFSTPEDNASLAATFDDAGGQSLGTASIEPVTSDDRGGVTALVERTRAGTLPAGTRRVTLVLRKTRLEGAANDGYADNLSLWLNSGTTAPGSVVVTTVDQDGRRVEGACLRLEPDAAGDAKTLCDRDKNGKTTFADLPVGTSTLSVTKTPGGYKEPRPDSVTVRAGQATKTTLRFRQVQRLAGADGTDRGAAAAVSHARARSRTGRGVAPLGKSALRARTRRAFSEGQGRAASEGLVAALPCHPEARGISSSGSGEIPRASG